MATRPKTKTKTKTRERVPSTITVTVEKCIQVVQFEPVRIAFTETYHIEEGDDPVQVRSDLYNQCSKTVRRMMEHELKKWGVAIEDKIL
jgi:murein L,D-transpeptidase YcbB/YkuD